MHKNRLAAISEKQALCRDTAIDNNYTLEYNYCNNNFGDDGVKNFVDRKNEMDFLEREYASKSASFVVLYGRRRTGKTAMIMEFIKNKSAVYYLSTEESETENRDAFADIVANHYGNTLLAQSKIQSWEPIFDVIIQNGIHQKQIIVIDEFQYIGRTNDSFLSVIQRIWDTKLQNANIMLILCGSLVNMMYQQTLSYNSPLYGRRTGQIKLKPIGFEYYRDFFPNMTERELIEYYAVTGGVPKYIESFHEEKNIYDAIEHNILSRTSYLYEEPIFLLEKEVREIGTYFSIIKTIASGRRKSNEIASALETAITKLPKYLSVLMDLDILEREVPVTETNPEKSKMGLYKIKDNFIEFWFKFVYPYRSYAESGYTELIMSRIKNNFVRSHAAYIYEEICRNCYMRRLAANGILGFTPDKIGRWWDRKNTEIDIVGIDSMGKDIVFGECKFTNDPMDVNVYYNLLEKAKPVKWRHGDRIEHFVFFSINGFTERMKQLAEQKQEIILA